jgi:Ubiquitin carboxyl-terminal hydrolase
LLIRPHAPSPPQTLVLAIAHAFDRATSKQNTRTLDTASHGPEALEPETVRAIVSAVSALATLPRRFLQTTTAAIATPSPSSLAARAMPSLALAETVSVTETIHAISGSALAAERFKELTEIPLHFKVAPTVVATGLNGRYTPLNEPFHVVNGIGGGAGGVNGTAASASSQTEGEGGAGGMNGNDGLHVNGDSGGKKAEVEAISTEWPRILQRPPGLKNFMNTCYMNSTLQALMHIPPLVSYLLKDTHNRQCLSIVSNATDDPGSKLPRTCTFCRLERHARESYPPTPQRQPWLTPRDIVGKDGGLSHLHST